MSKTKLENTQNSSETPFLKEEKEAATMKTLEEPKTWSEMMKAWPKSTFLIVGNEFCEKYSYLGMRSILTLYFLNVMKFGDKSSTVLFNGFTLVASLTPLLGSFVADGLIGKFKTIVAASVLFVVGQLLIAFSSFHSSSSPLHPWIDFIALIIIALSAGGTKPCVTAFGADQFDPNHTKMLSFFFALVYYFVNFGSATSAFVAPLFRSMSCFGYDNCYPLAFGISALLMILATIVFLCGSYSYKKKAPKGNIFGDFVSVIKGAMFNKGPKRNHWLERYLNTHDCEHDSECMDLKRKKRNPNACQKVNLIKDIRDLGTVLVMYLPLPIYWALYDQQGSVWLIQGIQMDCRIWGNTLLLPDQIHLLNPVLCLIFIPMFQIIIYPCLSKCFNVTLLRKIVAGGILATLAFVATGILQLEINKTLSDLPPENHAYVSVMNSLKPGCTFSGIGNFSFPELPYNTSLINNKQLQIYEMLKVPTGSNITFDFKQSCNGEDYLTHFTAAEINNKKIYNLIITELGAVLLEVNPEKPRRGTGEFSLSFVMALNDTNYQSHLALCRVNPNDEYPCDPRRPENFFYFQVNYNDGKDSDLKRVLPYYGNNDKNGSTHLVSSYKYKAIRPGKFHFLLYRICVYMWMLPMMFAGTIIGWSVWYMHSLAKSFGMQSLSPQELNITSTGQYISITEQGGVYAAVFTGSYLSPEFTINQIVPSNTVSILWQIPQYILITLAEVLFAISGNEFAYSQAPPSMKAVVYALWMCTGAIGDLIIIVIALFNIFEDIAVQCFVYAGAMFVVIIIFALMSIFYYEYKTYSFDDSEEKNQLLNEENNEMVVEINQP